MHKIILTILLLATLFVSFCAKSGNGNEENEEGKSFNIEKKLKKFLTSEDLEAVGFEHIKPGSFSILLGEDGFYLKNTADHMVVRFNRDKKPLKVYKASGQAPGEFLNPGSMFFYDPGTIAIHDIMKSKLLFFDLDLNFKEETRIDSNIVTIGKTKDGFIAFKHNTDHLFAWLDKNLKVVETFAAAKKKLPFKNLFPTILNAGYILDEHTVARASGLLLYKECKIDIIDVNSKKITVSLKWKNPHPLPTQKDIDARRNQYYLGIVRKHKNCYVAHAGFVKKLSLNPKYDPELLIFKENGELYIKLDNSSYTLIYSNDKETIYFFDNNEDISVLDADDLFK